MLEIPLEYLKIVERALLTAAARCDAPEPVTPEAKTEIRRRVLEEILRVSSEWRPEIRITSRERIGGAAGYTVERLEFTSWEGITGAANLYVPNGVHTPPAMLMNHGHAMTSGKFSSSYQRMAQYLAEQGIAVVVPDVLGTGERTRFGHAKRYEPFGCGTTVCGLIVLEAMGWLRWLRNEAQFDRKRIGVFGQSGGGQTTLFMCATVPDEAELFAPCGFVHTFEYNARKERPLCACDLFPATVGSVEMRHLIGCVAPKPVLVASGRGDSMIPRDVTLALSHRLAETWRACGAEGNFEHLLWHGEHRWENPEAFAGMGAFIAKHFHLDVPEQTGMTAPALFPTTCEIETELRPGEIDIDELAERLTGVKRKGYRRVADAFPPTLIPADAAISDEARDILAQMESFIRK